MLYGLRSSPRADLVDAMRVRVSAFGCLFCIAVASGCSSNFSAKACTSDAECGDGYVCTSSAASKTCARATSVPLRIGMSVPLSGPSQSLGTEMKKGVSFAFDAQNALGGVRGRRLQLDVRDDQYVPALAETAVRALVDVQTVNAPPNCPTTATPLVTGQTAVSTTALEQGPDSVFALLGNVGTPTMVRTAPIAVETKTLFFGPFTGAARMLRDGAAGPCAKYIFNVRASYAEEARATTEFFLKVGVPDAAHFLSFDQNDSFGQAGYDGLVTAVTTLLGPIRSSDATNPIKRFRFTRDDQASVPAQVQADSAYIGTFLADGKTHTVGIFMTDTYGPGAAFVTAIRDWQYADADRATHLNLYLSHVSFVGADALAQRLTSAGAASVAGGGTKPYTDNVFVSQVVPNYQTDSSDAVNAYRTGLTKASLTPSFTSLEGYLAARIFIEGLLANQGPATSDALIAAFEQMPPMSLGFGAGARFTTDNHQYSKSVWGTALLKDGTFGDRYFWTDGAPLQLFE